MSLTRVLKTAAITLRHSFYVDETLTNASGSVTYAVKRLDGSAVVSGTATNDSAGVYSFVNPGYANLDTHTVDWSGTWGGSVTTVRDILEIVGDHLYTIPEFRAMKPALSTQQGIFSLAELTEKRIRVEQECERICKRAFVPRFTRLLLNGNGTSKLVIPDLEPRLVRAASTATRAGGTFTAITGAALTAIAAVRGGVLVRDDGNVWPEGYQNCLVEYEYGVDYPPGDLKDAAMRRHRGLLTSAQSTIPDRALSFSLADGGVYRLSTPSATRTGMPDVDGIYEGYSLDSASFS